MKRILRIGLRASLFLSALVGLLLVLSLDGVDTQPYFKTPYYANTMARWRDQMTSNGTVRGELWAGFGRALLTPTLHVSQDNPVQGQFRALPLAGYGNRQGRPATGVHDDLYVKAVAMRVGDRMGVMVGADALIIPPEVTELAIKRINSELKLQREQIYLSATHSHCSLGGWGEGLVAEAFAGEFQAGTRLWISDRIVSAVSQAIADLKPAMIGCGRFAAPELVRNRLVGDLGRRDPEFSYLVVRQIAGRQAVLGSYSAHATVLSGKMMEFSGDYPGFWQRAVEAETGGMAVFLAGGMGSHSPVAGESGLKGAERMGQALAKPLLEQLPGIILTNTLSFDIRGLEVSLPSLHARISDNLRLRPWVASRLLPVGRSTFLQIVRLDDSVWISTPCDYSGELALDFKAFVCTRGWHAVITSFNGDYIGYVIPSRYYYLDGYEPRTMSFFGPCVPDYFEELIQTMALGVMQSPVPNNPPAFAN